MFTYVVMDLSVHQLVHPTDHLIIILSIHGRQGVSRMVRFTP